MGAVGERASRVERSARALAQAAGVKGGARRAGACHTKPRRPAPRGASQLPARPETPPARPPGRDHGRRAGDPGPGPRPARRARRPGGAHSGFACAPRALDPQLRLRRAQRRRGKQRRARRGGACAAAPRGGAPAAAVGARAGGGGGGGVCAGGVARRRLQRARGRRACGAAPGLLNRVSALGGGRPRRCGAGPSRVPSSALGHRDPPLLRLQPPRPAPPQLPPPGDARGGVPPHCGRHPGPPAGGSGGGRSQGVGGGLGAAAALKSVVGAWSCGPARAAAAAPLRSLRACAPRCLPPPSAAPQVFVEDQDVEGADVEYSVGGAGWGEQGAAAEGRSRGAQ
jgi:hypothetical protein